jgi:hypothetical protein
MEDRGRPLLHRPRDGALLQPLLEDTEAGPSPREDLDAGAAAILTEKDPADV